MQRLNGAALQGPFGGRIIKVAPSNKWRTPDGGPGGVGVGVGGPPPQMMMMMMPAGGMAMGVPR